MQCEQLCRSKTITEVMLFILIHDESQKEVIFFVLGCAFIANGPCISLLNGKEENTLLVV